MFNNLQNPKYEQRIASISFVHFLNFFKKFFSLDSLNASGKIEGIESFIGNQRLHFWQKSSPTSTIPGFFEQGGDKVYNSNLLPSTGHASKSISVISIFSLVKIY